MFRNNYIEMFFANNEGKSVLVEIYIITLKIGSTNI